MNIEKNIPVPEIRRSMGEYKYPFRTMEVGDSFLYTDNLENPTLASQRISAITNTYIKKHKLKIKFSSRRVEGGIRVWRVK